MNMYADKIVELMGISKKNNNTEIFNDYDHYYLNIVDYKKYFKLEYITFINLDIDNIILNFIKR